MKVLSSAKSSEIKKTTSLPAWVMLHVLTHNTEPYPRWQAMKSNNTFVGLDVHKNSIDIALADDGRDGKIFNVARYYACSFAPSLLPNLTQT